MGTVRQPVPASFASAKESAPAMHDTHQKIAELHELAAHAHLTAAEHNDKGDNETGNWHAQRALEYSDRAYKLAKEAHAKSGQIVTL
jgi:hypothetical protein